MAKSSVELYLKDFVSPGLKTIQGAVGSLIGPIGFAGLVYGMKKFADSANESEVASKRLRNALGSDGAAGAIEEYATELQKSLGVSDEAVKNAATLGAQFGLSTDQIKGAIDAAADLSTALGGDLQSNMELLTKAAETGSSRALKPLGITFEDTGSKSKNLAILLDLINKKIGTDAETAAKTGQGAVKKLGEAWGEFGETVGGAENTAFTPIINFLASMVNGLTDAIKYTDDERLATKKLGLAMAEVELQKIEIANKKPGKLRGIAEAVFGIDPMANQDFYTNYVAKAKADIADLEADIKKKSDKPKDDKPLGGKNDETEKARAAREKAEKEDMERQQAWWDWQIAGDDLVNEEFAKGVKEKADAVKKSTDDMAGFFKDMATSSLDAWSGGLDKMGEQLANFLIASIKAWVATEIGKYIASSISTMGFSLSGVPIASAAGGAAIAAIGGSFSAEQGGIVPGQSFQGDRVPARVNSGEMVINRQQQQNLFNMANGRGGRGGGTQTINVQIDGRTIGRAVTRQNARYAYGMG